MLQHQAIRTLPIVAALSWTACGGGGHQVEGPELDLTIGRLDRALFHAPPDSMAVANLKAYAEFGEFHRVYIEDILQGAPLEDPRLPLVLNRFVHDPDWAAAQRGVDSLLGDMAKEEQAFEQAFSRLKAFFPDSLVPRIVVFNSGYNFGIFPTDSVLGIGAEWFIGSDHPVVKRLAPENFPAFMKARMVPEMLVPSALKGWLLVHYTRDIAGADVLTNLVEVGKVMALLDVLLPDTPDHLKLAFSKEQLAWCEANEYEIWRSVVGQDKLFSRKMDDIGRLMNDGPFTNGMPRESPGHIGEWVGLRMVQAFMKDHPKMTFAELFALDDPRVILKSYKPR